MRETLALLNFVSWSIVFCQASWFGEFCNSSTTFRSSSMNCGRSSFTGFSAAFLVIFFAGFSFGFL